ncbi:MAG: hypothetical protein H6Q13_2459 [Bacteroidetes bacterium]|nr:hypothetical protein [Bacteroidota bacterium]
MNKAILSIIYFLLYSTSVSSQTDKILMSNYVPPSPNAQTLLKCGEFPVSNYTGVPNIDIPIYNIKLKDISLPITISYNASGIKVNEESSRVGLGWSLNAGGIITHTVIGRYNDFCAWSYFYYPSDNYLTDITGIYHMDKYTIAAPRTTLPFTLQGMTHENLYNALTNDDYKTCGGVELTPDVFNYNFLGYSGKFIFSHSGKIIKEKEDNLKIVPITQKKSLGWNKLISWIMTAPDGTKYYFEQAEETTFADRPREESYNSAFYLTRIESVNGSVISLNYKKEKQYLGTFTRPQDSNPETYISTSHAYYDVVYLDKITYPLGGIRFEYKFDREDYTPEVRLSAIYIDDVAGINVNSWELLQSYFVSNTSGTDMPSLQELNGRITRYDYYNTSWNNSFYTDSWNKKRLKLQSIRHTSTNTSPEVYSFSYNETVLPTKLSTSQDHWGYYNGANNKALIPSFWQNTSQLKDSVIIEYIGGSADRNPNPAYNSAFILQEITYPTGGKAKFVYESNKYKTNDFENDESKRDFMFSSELITLSANQSQGGNNIPHLVKSFSLPINNQSFFVSAKLVIDKSLYSSANPELEISVRKNMDDDSALWIYKFNSLNLPNPSSVTVNQAIEKSWHNITLPAGSYVLLVKGSLLKQLKSIDVTGKRVIYPTEYLAQTPTGIGGGLRIKEINFVDKNAERIHGKKYYYTTNSSSDQIYTSGRLMFYPRYRKDYHSIGSNGLRGSGYSVGYTVVNVEDIDKNGNRIGLSKYEYINTPDKNLYYTWWDGDLPYGTGQKAKDENPPGIGDFKYSENGTLLKETVFAYKSTGYIKQRETEYTYSMLGDGPNIIWGILKTPLLANERNKGVCYTEDVIRTLVDLYGSNAYSYIYCKIPIGYLYPALRPMQILLSKKKDTLYDGSGKIETVAAYTYNLEHFYKTKETIESAGQIIRSTEYVYPPDKQSNEFIKKLVDANRILDPIEIKESVNSSLNHTIKDYKLFNDVSQLAVVKTNTGENQSVEDRVVYHKYDDYGNPLYISTDGADDVVYLWGYQGQYMIAKVDNATYEDVKRALGVNPESLSSSSTPNMTLMDGLRTKLVNSHVSTYTYEPLVGLRSVTDQSGIKIYYTYDNLGRLKEKYIMEGTTKKILQTYEYNYVNQ